MESRIHGDVYVRFGGELLETYRSNTTRSRVLSLQVKYGKTPFTATEYIKMKNPILRTLSYIFFDIGKFMEVYQKDLAKKIKDQHSLIQ